MTEFLSGRKRRKSYSDEEILIDLKRCAELIKKDTITMAEYDAIPGINHSSRVMNRFKGWQNALNRAGLSPSRSKINIPHEELMQNLRKMGEELHRLPTYNELKAPLSRVSVGTYENRFGSWNAALDEFENWLSIESDDLAEENEPKISNTSLSSNNQAFKHRTKREISDRMRFRILMRDGFTCKSCGASPLKANNIELHVDHKIPWSLGGETIIENLETKCARCNLGKSNAFSE